MWFNYFVLSHAVLPSEDIYKYSYSNFGSTKKDNGSESSIIKNKNDDLEAASNSNPPRNCSHSNCCKFFYLIE